MEGIIMRKITNVEELVSPSSAHINPSFPGSYSPFHTHHIHLILMQDKMRIHPIRNYFFQLWMKWLSRPFFVILFKL